MLAKRFFFVSAGILCLALAYHFGATSATAQSTGNPVVGMIGGASAAITANGDVYELDGSGNFSGNWHRASNIFGAATGATQRSWGQVKARYR